MKKTALKLLALLMALTLVVSFAACGKNGDGETTTAADETTTDSAPVAATQPTEPIVDDATVQVEESTIGEETTIATEESSVPESSAADESTTKADEGFNSTDIAEVVAFYNKAHAATVAAGAPKGQSTMKLDGSITGDGAIGALLKVLSPVAKSALEKNSTATDYVPGKGKLTAADVSSASATTKDGVTTISIKLKPQTDGPTADPEAGPVGRGIGTLGNVDKAIQELGAELTEGKDTIKLTYNNAYIECKVNEKTGKITGGTWHYTVNILVGEAKAKLGLTFNLKNLKAKVDYKVAI